jgi:lysophospholipase L1-like esterase
LHRSIPFIAAFLAAGIAGLMTAAFADGPTSNGGIIVKPGQKVAFLGASISEFGWRHPGGYIKLTVDALKANGVEIVPIPAGVSGNTSADMLARLDRDVIGKKPDWMTVDAGGNDVWHGTVPFDQYMENMTAIVDRAQAAGIHVILQTCTPIGEDQNNEFNPKLAYYNQFLRYLAAHKHCVLADLNADTLAILKTKTGTDNLLTTDGVHMNDRGNRVMAAGLLKTMGLTEEQIAKTITAGP